MKTSTFENRTKSVNKTTKGYKFAKELLMNRKGCIYTCHHSGSGRFTTCLDYTKDTINVLELAGLKKDIDFIVENDSPRGGKTGNYIKLTYIGKKKSIN
jgi:hypothetical protein